MQSIISFSDLRTQGKFRQLRLECQELIPHPSSEARNCHWSAQPDICNGLSHKDGFALETNTGVSALTKWGKKGLYVLCSIELFLPCMAWEECVGQSKNNETMNIITFLQLLRGKKQPAAVLG